jgi:hypothetical protein
MAAVPEFDLPGLVQVVEEGKLGVTQALADCSLQALVAPSLKRYSSEINPDLGEDVH